MEQIRCNGCMKLKSSDPVCEYCGYDESSRNAPHQLPVGTVLKEQYRIGRVLGQGGFGITYIGWDLYLDIPVAIKEYYPSGTVMRESTVTMEVADVTGDDGVRFRNNRDRFMREAKMLARFSQVPEIVQVKNFFLANNTAYIVMEYVEGITLKQHVKNSGGKLSVEETFSILGPVMETLAKVHKTGIIHRDISPDNIMMVPGGAKLLDFGAVRSVSAADTGKELTKSTEAILKQGYAPIEQYQKKGALGPWTDVYALCATICYCLTGEVPPDAPARMLDYEDVELDKVEGLEKWQLHALSHGMELRAENRTPSMEQLHRELFEPEEEPAPEPVSEPEPVSVPEPKPVPEPKSEIKRYPRSEIQLHPRTEQVTEVKPSPKSDPKPDPKSDPKPDPKPESGPKEKTWKKNLLVAVALLAVICLIAAVAIGINEDGTGEGLAITDPRKNMVSGDCGSAAWWKLDLDTGVMTISGVHMFEFYLEEYDEQMRRYKMKRPWEEYTDQITEVVLEDTLYRVGNAAFAHCPNLTKVTFGKGLKEIGADAFWDTGLTFIDLPGSLEVIEWGAFEHTQVKKVSIPVLVQSLGHGAFANCPQLENVELLGRVCLNYDTWDGMPIFNRGNNSVEDITLWAPPGGMVEDYANIFGYQFQPMGSGVIYEAQGDFSGFPGNVDGHWYFDRESGFLKIEGEMPTDMLGQWEIDRDEVQPNRKNVPQVPWYPFCDEIRVVSVGEGVTRICNNAFAGLWNLTDVHLPTTLKSIGFQSFMGTNLDEIYIPDSVTQIESFAFNWCQNLRLARLPIGLKVLDSSVFSVNHQLQEFYVGNRTEFVCRMENGQQITPFNNMSQPEHNEMDENTLPQNLTIFSPQGEKDGQKSPAKKFAEEYGFGYAEGILECRDAEVTGDALFCSTDVYWALQDGTLYITGQGETPYYRSGNQDRNAWHQTQSAYMTQQGEAPWYPYRNEIHSVIVVGNVTALNRGILCNMPNLEYVDLGKVERLYDGAIENCGITHIDLPDNLNHVHKGAIRDCIDLQSIHVHNGSEKMDHGAFQGNDHLQELVFWSGGEMIGRNFDLFDGNVPRDLVIRGREGSMAQQYAQRCGIPFEIID